MAYFGLFSSCVASSNSTMNKTAQHWLPKMWVMSFEEEEEETTVSVCVCVWCSRFLVIHCHLIESSCGFDQLLFFFCPNCFMYSCFFFFLNCSSFRFRLRRALPCILLCWCVLPACEQIPTLIEASFFFFFLPAFRDRITNRSWWFSIPLGNWFSGVVTMWRWKTISKALNRCCNYLSRLLHKHSSTPV